MLIFNLIPQKLITYVSNLDLFFFFFFIRFFEIQGIKNKWRFEFYIVYECNDVIDRFRGNRIKIMKKEKKNHHKISKI